MSPRPPASYSFPQAYKTLLLSHYPPTSSTPTPIILIALNRPQQKNAFTDEMARELVEIFDVLDGDDRVKCIVFTSGDVSGALKAIEERKNQNATEMSDDTGNKGAIFCAGADLDEGLSYEHETGEEHRDGGGMVALAIHGFTKPVVAAVNGSAVGVGITMTLPMSIRIVSSTAKIGFVFARRGIVMEACSAYFLPRLIGYSKTMHLITTGSIYPATHPLLSSLFSEILPPAQVLPRALEIATEIVENTSAVSTALMRDLVWRGPGTAEESQVVTSRLLWGLFRGRDKAEGIKSFLEKRKPKFEGTMGRDAPEGWPWWKVGDGSRKSKI